MESTIQSTKPAVPVSKSRLWAGRILSLLPLLLLAFSGVMKLARPAPVLEGFARYGYSEHLIPIIGTIELLCCVIYAIPRTSVLGAILLTGYLGGATATNLRIGDPSYWFTFLLGVLLWVGLYLREERLSTLLPFRN
jgi:hypothetical protein